MPDPATTPASTTTLPDLLERIEQRERKARRNAILYSILPVGLTIALLSYTTVQVKHASAEAEAQTKRAEDAAARADRVSQEVASLQKDAAGYRDQAAQLKSQLAETEKRLATATDFAQYARPIGFVEAKELASRFPGSEHLLITILQYRERGTGWKLGGRSPNEGFDSPGFAMFILSEIHSPTVAPLAGESLIDASRRLFERLPATSAPKTGDLIFYPSGYALFYFESLHDAPFVLGMTPFGITSLKPDFAKPVGYRRTR